MPGFMDRMKAIKEYFKPPKQTKPDPKGFIRAANKTFHCMLSCLKCQKDEDDCPGLPEVKTSYIDEEIPESLSSQSYISLTDSESDGCPAEADLGSRSDSLEGIPEMLEAESLPSLLENNEEKEAADGEKDLSSHDPCPAEAEPNPAPASDGLPQPQVTNAVEAIPETLLVESLSSSTVIKESFPPFPPFLSKFCPNLFFFDLHKMTMKGSEAGTCPAEGDPGPVQTGSPQLTRKCPFLPSVRLAVCRENGRNQIPVGQGQQKPAQAPINGG
ncbi:uncharacterized protein LOC121933958 [Sceloporus undulatus]|uniref:uncharacterized protein LOC121933958 n=1 Tax=Sceloporus undulatus TaxID=8520 RepID=UPI001C4BB49A|nr:uncharacterized protein LOC121933958 [Sceloporus undulatus]